MSNSIQLGVAGGAVCSPEHYAQAEAVGREIARAGAVLLCGGRQGVMEAAAKGASEAGGVTIGILPGPERGTSNRYIRYEICSGLGQARNVVFVLSCDALIAVGGEYGTLCEIAIALKQRIPVVGLDSWRIAALEREPLYAEAGTPAEAVRLACELASRGRGRRDQRDTAADG